MTMPVKSQGVPVEANLPETLVDGASCDEVLNLFFEGELDDTVAEVVVAPALAGDHDYLKSLIDGSGDLMAEDTFARLEPMFAKYEGDADMMTLLEQAAQAYGDAAVNVAQRLLKKAD